MILHQLKFARRTFLKDRFYSSLNLFGLALGISVGIILLLILQSDLTYDRHYASHKRVYRVGAKYQIPGTDAFIGTTARELAPILAETYPEIEASVRIQKLGRQLVNVSGRGIDRALYESKVIQTDSSYFNVFRHAFASGDATTCLIHPRSTILTSSTARKYFDQQDPLGEIMLINNEPYTITGVIADLPENTHLKFDILIAGLQEIRPTWDTTMKNGKPISLVFWNPDVYTYLLMPDNYDVERFHSRFQSIYDQYYKEVGDESGGSQSAVLQPLASIHFSGFDDNELAGNAKYLMAFSAVGLMIVLLACINYMNLSTAKAMNRATEVAVKKIVGCGKGILFRSFIVESIWFSLMALVIAAIMVGLVVNTNLFSELTGKYLSVHPFNNPLLVWGSISIALIIGLVSGLYPAVYIPGIPVAMAIKGKYKSSPSGLRFRRVLITVQFTISIFVISCTLYMRNQIDFLMEKDLGFANKNILVVPVYDKGFRKSLQSFKNTLLQNPGITSVTASESTMGMPIGDNVMFGEAETGMQEQGGILALFVDDDYLQTLGITLVSGRDFRPGEGVDESGVYIANEAAVRLMGWGDNALGKKVTFWGGANPGSVIGVVKDFNAASLHQEIAPMFIVKGNWSTGLLQIQLTGENVQETITFVKNQWSQIGSTRPFEYFFLDQRFDEQYREDITQNKLLNALSYWCIFISLLGLLGLSVFTTTQRTREVGIRKILGARVSQILYLLSKDIVVLVVLSSVLALPVCGFVMVNWLETFAYRGELSYWLYILITLLSIGVVFLTISAQAYKTCSSNPVESLKHE